METNAEPIVYIVDDHLAIRESLELLCEVYGLRTSAFKCAEDFLDVVDHRMIGCIVLDLQLPGMGGLELVQELQRRCIALPVIVMSAKRVDWRLESSLGALVVAHLIKPVLSDVMLERIQYALESPNVRRP